MSHTTSAAGPFTIDTLQKTQANELVNRLKENGVALLRDQPGTGKTAVALCAVLGFVNVGQAKQALVVLPNIEVLEKWSEEWDRVRRAEGIPESSKDVIHFVTASSLVDAAPPPTPADSQPKFYPLVVIDEAHRGYQKKEGVHYQRLKALLARLEVALHKAPALLVVTATPFQLSITGLEHMLRIGGHGSIEPILNGLGTLSREFERCLQRRVNARRTGSKLRADDLEALEAHHRNAEALLEKVAPKPMQRYPAPKPPVEWPADPGTTGWLTAYHVATLVPNLLNVPGIVGEGVSSVSAGDLFARCLVSSSESFWKGTAGKALTNHKAHPRWKNLHSQLKARLGEAGDHPKVAATVRWAMDRYQRGHHVMVFCTFIETQSALEVAFKEALKTAGLADDGVFAPDDRRALDGKNEELKCRFRRHPEGKPLILIARDNLSESIDLDGGCVRMIHHDLPWNPARIQQRVGRLTRRSSKFMAVTEHACTVLPVEIDRRVAAILNGRSVQVAGLMPLNFEAGENNSSAFMDLLNDFAADGKR